MSNRSEFPRVRHADSRSQQPAPSPSFLTVSAPDGSPWVAYYRNESGYLVRFPGLADFGISNDGTELTIFAVPGTSLQTLEHLCQNQAIPLALSLQKKLVLHGSAVEIGEISVAFLGESGRGKSTLAASFSSHGYRFLTDDGLFIERAKGHFFVRPSHPSIRLWDDSSAEFAANAVQPVSNIGRSVKARLLAGDTFLFCTESLPLGNVYFLGSGNSDDVTITPIRGQEIVIETIRHCFLLGVDEHEILKHNFQQLGEFSRLPIFFRLDYPRRYDMLDRVRDAVIGHAQIK